MAVNLLELFIRFAAINFVEAVLRDAVGPGPWARTASRSGSGPKKTKSRKATKVPRAGPYVILGVARDHSREEIERAYRRLAFRCHPDRTGGDDTRIKRLNDAIEAIRRERGWKRL